MPAAKLSEVSTLACLFFIFLVPFCCGRAGPDERGLGTVRAAPAYMMMSSLCALAVACLVYFVCGFSWQGYIGGPEHALTITGKSWNWIAAQPLFFRTFAFDGSAASVAALFQIFCVGLAALIPLGSGADRWRLRAICLHTATAMAGCAHLSALRKHWVWGGGWLAQLGGQLRHRPRISGCRRLRVNSGCGRPGRLLRSPDFRAAPRKIFRGRHGSGDSRAQLRTGSVWLLSDSGRVARNQFRRRDSFHGRRGHPVPR